MRESGAPGYHGVTFLAHLKMHGHLDDSNDDIAAITPNQALAHQLRSTLIHPDRVHMQAIHSLRFLPEAVASDNDVDSNAHVFLVRPEAVASPIGYQSDNLEMIRHQSPCASCISGICTSTSPIQREKSGATDYSLVLATHLLDRVGTVFAV